MAIKIPAPVLWDANDNFYNNSLVNADGFSTVVGTVSKPNRVYPPSATPNLQSTLQIKETTFGTLYLNMTLEAWEAALAAAGSGGGSGAAPQTIIYPITGGTSTITDSALLGATILSIWVNGIMIYYGTDVTLSGDTLTFVTPLDNGSTVGVLFVIE